MSLEGWHICCAHTALDFVGVLGSPRQIVTERCIEAPKTPHDERMQELLAVNRQVLIWVWVLLKNALTD